MELKQTAQLLARASAIDNRIVTEATIAAWHEILAPIGYDDAIAALRTHRATSTDYLTPAHITGIIRVNRAAAALRPTTDPTCDLHDGYPLTATGRCDQCTRYPEDRRHHRLTGEKPAMLPIGDLGTIGRGVTA